MSHCCFISFKKEDTYYKDKILEKLGRERIQGKSLDKWIDSKDIDYVMQVIRRDYMNNSTVTLFLIGEHSSENEGFDERGFNKQNFIIRELQATLYNRKGNPRDGLLGIVLPSMEQKNFNGKQRCERCGKIIEIMDISDSTVIREFHENYWLSKNGNCDHYDEDGQFAVLCRYSEFMSNPDIFINKAYEKTKHPIARQVHFSDIKHKYRRYW
ncbi:MAG: TIR domain-containing protein [Bacilli bacterium]|jgi:hypothetical protein